MYSFIQAIKVDYILRKKTILNFQRFKSNNNIRVYKTLLIEIENCIAIK